MHIRLQVLLGPFLLGASAMAPSREITELHRTVAKLRKQLADCQAATKSRDGGMAVDAVRDGMAVTAGARLQVRQAPEQEQAHSLQESMAKTQTGDVTAASLVSVRASTEVKVKAVDAQLLYLQR